MQHHVPREGAPSRARCGAPEAIIGLQHEIDTRDRRIAHLEGRLMSLGCGLPGDLFSLSSATSRAALAAALPWSAQTQPAHRAASLPPGSVWGEGRRSSLPRPSPTM